MSGHLQLIADAAEEPVTLVEAKAHLRVDVDAEDDLITALITAARQMVEQITRRALLSQDWELRLEAFPADTVIELPCPPLQSVSALTYIDGDNVSHTVEASTYQVDTGSTPGRLALVAGASWPGDTLRSLGGVQIAFTAGWTSAEAVPLPIRAALLLLVGHLYENREAVTDTRVLQTTPLAFEYLLWPWRVLGW